MVEDLPVGVRQRVEIVKTLYRNADILILDEPTAVLTPQEIDGLFDVMELLRTRANRSSSSRTSSGSAAHQRPHHCAARRQGSRRSRPQDRDPVHAGRDDGRREVILTVDKDEAQPGPVVLDMQDVSAKDDHGQPALRNVSRCKRAPARSSA